MQPAELLYVPKSRLMINFHASFKSYYILLWQLFYVPLFVMYVYTLSFFTFLIFFIFFLLLFIWLS